TLRVATVNGSGSQTANVAILRSLFRMGIPVSGKNIFPSNIQGLPTWYTIRLSAAGYAARSEAAEILVAVNPATFAEDLRSLPPGGVCFHPDHLTPPVPREDVVFYPMPIQRLVREANPPKNLRDYIANMAYVGVVAQMLGIEPEAVRSALSTHFRGRSSAVDLNMGMVQAAADWAKDNLVKRDPYRVERSNQTAGMILVDGNTAAALGAHYGGVSFAAWYPITPASSLAEALGEYLPQLRKDPETGKLTCAVVAILTAGAPTPLGVDIPIHQTAEGHEDLMGFGQFVLPFLGQGFFVQIEAVVLDARRAILLAHAHRGRAGFAGNVHPIPKRGALHPGAHHAPADILDAVILSPG
ncbi:MAG: hypothetical protein HGB17_17985, partial [Syntrophobacteraceae bacterium]|nr:hypothetical protein [Syntrophobacteraceae bacterium]